MDVNNDDPEVLVATEESMPNIAPTPETPNHEPSQPPESAKSYVSPSDIHPLLKAPRRAKSTRGRKKATTRILTNTPVRDEIASKYLKPVSNQSNKNNSQDVIAKRSLFQSKKLQQKVTKQSRVEESSSDDSESDMEIEYESEDTEPEDLGFIEGDFVIVRVEGKKRVVHYVARIDVVDEELNEYEGVFLQKDSANTFLINANDQATFEYKDIVKKLPKPKSVGGTSRLACKLSFGHDMSKWQI